jgi:hypothetical protein
MDDLMTTDACTLPTADRPLRLAEFDDLFAGALQGLEHDDVRACLRLTGDAGLRERVRDLARRETACCSFFTFVVEGTADAVTLDVSVPPEHSDILAALVGRATEPSA